MTNKSHEKLRLLAEKNNNTLVALVVQWLV